MKIWLISALFDTFGFAEVGELFNEGSGEIECVALDFRSDEVVFDLLVDNVEDNEDDGGQWRTEEKKGANKDTADNGTEHRNEIKSEGD